MTCIHIYGQPRPHEEVYVVGDVMALTALRDALSAFITAGVTISLEVTAADREGYVIKIASVSSDVMDELMLPYTDPVHAAQAGQGTPPYEVIAALENG